MAAVNYLCFIFQMQNARVVTLPFYRPGYIIRIDTKMSVPADVQNENAGDGSANWGPVSVNQSQQQKSEIEAQQRSESIRLQAENLRLEAENEVLRRELAIRQAEKEKLLIDNARLKRALSSLLAGPEE